MSSIRFFRYEHIAKTITRLYCNNKPINVTQKSHKTENDEEEITVARDSSEECAKFEELTVKKVTIEKEKDAQIRIRLSKECKIFFSGNSDKPSTSINYGSIRIEETAPTQRDNDWLSYNFGQLEPLSVQTPPGSVKPQLKGELPSKPPAGELIKGKSGGSGGPPSSSGPRPIRQEPGKVFFACIPEFWWSAFVPKTGVTGFWTFLFTFTTFLVSKEYYVLEHEFYTGLSMFLVWVVGIKYVGPPVAKYLDKGIDDYAKSWSDGRTKMLKGLEDEILDEVKAQYEVEGQLLLCDVKRENVHLQLEEEFRKRQIMAYEAVKKRLDYQVAVQLAKQRIQHRNLVDYVTKEVLKSITPEMQKKLVYYSIDQIALDIDKEKHKK